MVDYRLSFKPIAIKQLERLDRVVQRRISGKLDLLMTDLQGDVKRLTNFMPDYRLRVGD